VTASARWALLPGLLALSGCGAGTSVGGGEPSGAELGVSVAAVCAALEQVEADRSAAVATFQNDAHHRLHALAAAPELDRSSAARLLEAKARVEAAIAGDAPSVALRRDLGEHDQPVNSPPDAESERHDPDGDGNGDPRRAANGESLARSAPPRGAAALAGVAGITVTAGLVGGSNSRVGDLSAGG